MVITDRYPYYSTGPLSHCAAFDDFTDYSSMAGDMSRDLWLVITYWLSVMKLQYTESILCTMLFGKPLVTRIFNSRRSFSMTDDVLMNFQEY